VSSTDVLDALVREQLSPALRQHGLRRSGRTWWLGGADSGWVLLALARGRYNDASRVQFSVETMVWPVGSWELEAGFSRDAAKRSRPDVRENAPLAGGPRELLPDRYGDRDWPWQIQRRLVVGIVDEVLHYCTDYALPLARRHLDVDVALHALTEQPRRWGPLARVWSLTYACAMLERAAPQHERFPATVVELRDLWLADPRPDYLGPKLDEWCVLTNLTSG
jgi:hypothetical protein